MKKFFYVLMAAATLVAVSCEKETGKGNNGVNEGDDTPLAQATYRIKTYNSGGDLYTYTYNEDGTVANIARTWETSLDKNYKFTYNGNNVTIENTVAEAKMYEVKLNDKKLAVEIKDYTGGELVTYTYEYDKNNFMVASYENDEIVCMQNIVDGNVEYWTRVGVASLVEEDIDAAGWRKKMHTYYSDENVAGIHTEWAEDSAMPRWLWETGFLGRASVNVCKTAHWYGVVNDDKTAVNDEYAAKLAWYPLALNEQGWVETETKYYDTVEIYESNSWDALEGEVLVFTCEPIAQ